VIKVEFLSVREPRWSHEDRRAIDCLVKTNTIIDEVPYTASADDVELHGRELYERLKAGYYGEIAPMEPRSVSEFPANFEMPPEYKILQKFLIETNLENGRKSSRSIVIVWASVLDNLLDAVLEDEASREKGAGVSVGKPPDSFSTRIALARKLGLIDSADAEKCHHVRRVRNAAAHEWQLSLLSKDVLPSLRALYDTDHSRYFHYHEDMDFLVQQIYAGSCVVLAIKFARRLRSQRAE
jgi:hypothetical protein